MMKHVLSILVILTLLSSSIPLAEATLVASPGTVIGVLSEGESKTFTMDDGDSFAITLTALNTATDRYVNLNIDGRMYEKLLEYDKKIRIDGTFGYDIRGGKEITIITVFPRYSSSAGRVQFAIAKKNNVVARDLSVAPTVTARKIDGEKADVAPLAPDASIMSVPSVKQQLPEPTPPPDRCTDEYRTCLTSVDTSIPGNIEKCVSSYYGCIGQYKKSLCGDGICEDKEVKSCPFDCAPKQEPLPAPFCGNELCEKGEEWKTCPSDCEEPYAPPAPMPSRGSVCKDTYYYCIDEQPLGFGDLWIQKFSDGSLKIGAKVIDDTGAATPEEGTEVTVQLSNRRMLKLIYDQVTAYYYTEALNQFELAQQGIRGEQKLRSVARKPEAGAVAMDVVIDFSAEGDEMEYHGIKSRWVRSTAHEIVPSTEKPSENYRAQREKFCRQQVDVYMQGCRLPAPVDPIHSCEDKCAQIPCAISTVFPIPAPAVMPMTGTVKLRYGETAPVVGSNFPEGEKAVYINFEDVDDARCAPHLNCFTAGSATVRLHVHTGPSKEYNPANVINLRIGDEAEPMKHTINGETYVFMLAELAQVASREDKEEYIAVIKVEGEGSGADCRILYDQCIKECKGKPYPTMPPPAIVCDNSCYSESLSKCIPYGIRLVEKESSLYCGISGNLEKQKQPGADAQNNYECLSNAASDGKCLDVQAQLSMLQKIWKFLSKLFGGE